MEMLVVFLPQNPVNVMTHLYYDVGCIEDKRVGIL